MSVPDKKPILKIQEEKLLETIDFSNYKKCPGEYVKDCYKISTKNNFKGKLCKNCHKIKQAEHHREKYNEGKILRSNVQEVQLILEPINEQLLEILGLEKLERLNKLLKLEDISKSA
jgi:hypothetical protein